MDTKIQIPPPKVSIPQPSEVDAGDVRAFVAVVDRGSVTGAAKALRETKGSVSRRLARLERVVGVTLADRTGRRVAPTEDGLAFYQRAAPAITQLEEAVSAVRDLRGEPRGHLRVTANHGTAPMLGPLLGAFAERYPAVSIEAVITEAVLSFGQDRIDVAFRLSQGLPDSSLVARKLFDLRGKLVASPAYLARHGAPATPDDLDHHRVLLPPLQPMFPLAFAGPHGTIRRMIRGHLTSHDALLLRDATVAGGGIALASPELAQADLDAGRLVEVLPDWPLVTVAGLYLVTAGGPLPLKTRAFRDFAVAQLRGSSCD